MKHKLRSNRMKKRRFRRRNKPGDTPGLIVSLPSEKLPRLHVMAYQADKCFETETVDLDQLPKLRSQWPVVWLHVSGVEHADTIRRLGQLFNLHPLALEDVIHSHQRPKVESYADHLFIVARMLTAPAKSDGSSQPLTSATNTNGDGAIDSVVAAGYDDTQLSIFVGQGFVLSFQDADGSLVETVRERIRESRGRIRSYGADYLAYALLDATVDHYFPLVESYSDQVELIEDKISTMNSAQIMHELHDLRGELMSVRRSIRPLRDALLMLMPDPNAIFTKDTQVYLRDCYDHVAQLLDITDTLRELCSDARDYYLSAVSNRMNEIMKVLTVIATIFMPLSFIVGLYGMNFNTQASPWNMPELNWRFGYPMALGIMLGIVITMLFFFRRRGWIGRTQPRI